MTRVLIVVNEFPAISETFVLDQITGLLDRGFDVQILASKRREESIAHPGIDAYDLPARSHYADWRNAGRGQMITRVFGRKLPKLGFEMIRLGVLNRLPRGAVSSPRQLLAFALTLQNMQPPDVVLCHFGVNGDLMIRLRAALHANWPVATIFHGYDISSILNEFGTHVYDRLIREGDLFLPVCDVFRRRLISLGAPEGKIQIQRMGARPQNMHGQAGARRSGGPFNFVTVGRMVEKKGHEFAIRALAQCRLDAPGKDFRLILIGEGPLMPALKAQVTGLALDDCVEFRGNQPRDIVIQTLLKEAKVFLLPSVTAQNGDMEASPVAISEAMSLGLPVISTFHSGIPELVLDGETGLLAAERDVPGLAAAMGRLAEAPEFAASLGAAGKTRLEAQFSLDRWNDLLAERMNALRTHHPTP